MLKGNVPILASAFFENGDLDLDSIERLMKFLLSQKIDGIALFGNASEGYALTASEKVAIINMVKRTVGDLPVVAAAGGASANVAIEDINRMKELGSDVAMVNPPSVIKPGPDAVYDFFRDVCANTDIDIMVQDAPMMTGVNIPVPTLAKICKDFDRVKYVKAEQPPTTLKISQLAAVLDGSAVQFGGLNAGYLFEELERGVIGTMPACEFPEVINAILNAYFAGDKATAREHFYKYLPFMRYGVQPGIGVSIHKEVLHRAGIFTTNHVRSPGKMIDQTTRDEMFAMLDELPLAVLGQK
ncbi:dihydrodipicolinate synthase family protein [Rhodobacteraceae bacterium RKSG542]|uniref:dihydrodipicolinate synthase family protein n=1 Tax=Pseudovibrio flavus TaxID=2529854 RepID=UPI0012BB7144|nr:dihydrodipicolinate synthase family protein [Pseudovibrio flavus]MTI17651.1 dihydrodipicolinate synthase family protein [Pseudovibrio flavus]